MARYFLRLKLALLGSAFRRGWQRAAGLLLGAAMALPTALVAAAGLALAGRRSDAGLAILGGAFVLLTLLWVVVPLVAFGLDETLDPGRLRLLPLTRRQLFVGLTVTSAVGVAPLATLLGLSGVVVGFVPVGPGAVLVVAGVVGQFVLCLVAARAVSSALSARLRSRRGRDVAGIVLMLLGASAGLLGQLPRLVIERADDGNLEAFRRAGEVASLTPLGWAARVVVAGAENRFLEGLGWLAALAVLITALAWWWMGSLAVASTSVETEAAPGRDTALYPRLVSFLPRTRLGATAAKELRYAWRVPQLRVQWLLLPLFATALVVLAILVEPVRRPEIVLAPAALAALQGLASINLFGADRGAVELLVGAGVDAKADLGGKNLSTLILVLPIMTVAAVALAIVTGGWSYVPLTLALTGALLGVAFGVGGIVSVYAPMPLPESPTNPFAGAAGIGATTLLLQGGAMLGELLLLAPVAVAVFLTALFARGLLPLVVAAGVLYGGLIALAGIKIASGRLRTRAPEFLEALRVRNTP